MIYPSGVNMEVIIAKYRMAEHFTSQT